jgi:hypothetical protein
MTKTTLLFQFRVVLPPWPRNGGLRTSDPRGAGCAAFLAEQLRRQGLTLLSEQPYLGEGGWSLDVTADDAAFTLSVHWLPLGAPPQDFWVVQIRPRLGPLAAILGTAVPEAALLALRGALERIVRAEDPSSEIRWSTNDESATA